VPRFAIAVLLLLVGSLAARAETAADHAVQLSARVTVSPASIKLTWLRTADAGGYAVARKIAGAATCSALASLPGTTAQFTDSRVATGVEYEYRVIKVAASYKAFGFISAGIGTAPVHDRGKVVLVVDDTQAAPLAVEIARLQQDLAGDGWTVLRHDVGRSDSVTSIRDLILADYRADRTKVKALFLLGHVPVPYSGNFAPDEHDLHVGAWPADVYYGIDSDAWTDTKVNNLNGADVRSRNAPGDGKFDQSYLPSNVLLQIGRVDLANLPAFSKSETALLRQYLDRDHLYRLGGLQADREGLIGDQFGAFGGEAFAADAWSSFAALLGSNTLQAGAMYPTVMDHSFQLAYACGGGSYTNVGNLAYTDQFAGQESRALIVAMFGSYFGDWDSPDNLLRGPLANDGYGLASVWAGRPFWFLHPLGQGHTLGYCARLTQNNTTTYPAGKYARGVHIALMGDPTLRFHPVPPPTQLTAAATGTGVKLTWHAPATAPLGYHIYRSADPAGPYQRLSKTIVKTPAFTDADPLPSATYQVRAIRLQASNSGTYYNNSQAAFADLP
jgi:hypothetical protein